MQLTPEAAVSDALGFLRDGENGKTLGVAVSGGGDSMALLLLASEWARREGMSVRAVTVDHGLRPEAAAEADFVGTFCTSHGIAHDVLRWTGWDTQGNLMAEARKARRTLIEDWAERLGVYVVLLGHTADDQVETFLMRLARGSGVDGLSGILADTEDVFLRPLLGVRRQALRDLLTDRGVAWIDDPTNDDARYDRIKARQMLPVLEGLGLTVDRVLGTVAHMGRARQSLGQAAVAFAKRHVRAEAGDLLFDRASLYLHHDDSPGRVLAEALRWIGGRDYRPRYSALTDMAEALRNGEARTLNGVQMVQDGSAVRLTRELAAVGGPVETHASYTRMIWDRRWAVSPPAKKPIFSAPIGENFPAGLTIRALGEDIVQCKGWRDVGLPRVSLMATPAIFDGAELIAAPIAGHDCGWTARIQLDFQSFLLSH